MSVLKFESPQFGADADFGPKFPKIPGSGLMSQVIGGFRGARAGRLEGSIAHEEKLINEKNEEIRVKEEKISAKKEKLARLKHHA